MIGVEGEKYVLVAPVLPHEDFTSMRLLVLAFPLDEPPDDCEDVGFGADLLVLVGDAFVDEAAEVLVVSTARHRLPPFVVARLTFATDSGWTGTGARLCRRRLWASRLPERASCCSDAVTNKSEKQARLSRATVRRRTMVVLGAVESKKKESGGRGGLTRKVKSKECLVWPEM